MAKHPATKTALRHYLQEESHMGCCDKQKKQTCETEKKQTCETEKKQTCETKKKTCCG